MIWTSIGRFQPMNASSRNSSLLRGTIAEGLTHAETGSLADDDTQLTKFHGFYQQDDRDLRAERGKQRMEKAFSFMVRMRVPAGILTPKQWLKVEKLAVERANHTIRLTTRETVQFHGILKGNLKPLMQGLHADLMDTIAACGDVNRNVIATAEPWRRDLYARSATWRATSRRICCRAPGPGTRSGWMRRRWPVARSRMNRSSAAPTCRANSRSPLRSLRTTMSMFSPMISALSLSCSAIELSVTTLWLAAAWG